MSKSKINVYFFNNGQPLKPPHKIVIDRKKLKENKVVERVNRLHYYNGYVVYTLFGELLRSIREIHNDSAFVVVPRDQCFLPGPYLKAFRGYINEKLPSLAEKTKTSKIKKSSTTAKGSTSGRRTAIRLQQNERVCSGCRHLPVDARCKHFGTTNAQKTNASCGCQYEDPQGICTTPKRTPSKSKVNRKKRGSGLSGCFRKKAIKKEPVVRLRKMDLERLEQQRAKKERRPKSRQGSACCKKKPTRTEYYRNMREKMVKQRNQRIVNEEKRKIKEEKLIQKRNKNKRKHRPLMARLCPCCIQRPPMILRPPPHNCVIHKMARDEACRRRQALQTAEQLSWESITVPPMKKKRIRGTQTTKEDLKQSRKMTDGGRKWFGEKSKKSDVEDKCEPAMDGINGVELEQESKDRLELDQQSKDANEEISPTRLSLNEGVSKPPSQSHSVDDEKTAPANVDTAGTQLDSLAVKITDVEKNLVDNDMPGLENGMLQLLQSVTEVKNEYQNLRKDLQEVQHLQKEMTCSLRHQLSMMNQAFYVLKKKIEANNLPITSLPPPPTTSVKENSDV
ncbi:uncharacterized protein LOC128739714 [Sabethes cyaneus]|uniref:uncharacterized protein LOC128739714 n=1 Tax=Sabethes cyaneus TaxID=53552 RepID=UPI00237E7663|nr:uncharacterized protein LOC128739714 [Sabethes cyaneus]